MTHEVEHDQGRARALIWRLAAVAGAAVAAHAVPEPGRLPCRTAPPSVRPPQRPPAAACRRGAWTTTASFFDRRMSPERRKRAHIHQLEALGYKVILGPAA